MSEGIPLRPVGKQDIHKLETYLLLGTLFREDVIERIRNAEDRLTWIDSLAVAAGALARSKAGMPATQIAEELGRTETTIRNHLNRKTEAGKLVWETYERLVRGKYDPIASILAMGEDIGKLKERIRELEDKVSKYEKKLSEVRTKLEELLEVIKKE